MKNNNRQHQHQDLQNLMMNRMFNPANPAIHKILIQTIKELAI